MKKTIILANGVKKEMTFEEVLKQFTPMINKAANIMMGKFNNGVEREDIIQEMQLETWKAFEQYDEEHAFSTILTYKLKKVTGNESQKITAQKRTSAGVLSMSETVGDTEDLTLGDTLGSEDFTEQDMIATEMMDIILSELNEREKLEFRCILYPLVHNSTTLAKHLNISRQAANQRINRTRTKIQNILIENKYAA